MNDSDSAHERGLMDMGRRDRLLSRREFMGVVGAGAGAMALGGCTSGTPRAPHGHVRALPNFIIVFTDDQGYNDLGCFGSPDIRTPCIDRMAEEGMKFTDFYCAAPVCTPSRAALMTGCYAQRVSLAGPQIVLHPGSTTGLHPDEITIATLLKQRKYATACIGKWHLGHLQPFLPTRHGFDYYYGIPYSNDMVPTPLMRNEEVIEQPAVQETLTERYTEEAIRFIQVNKDRPFFLYLPHTMPHTPLHVSDRFSGRSAAGLYGDAVECIDWSTGEILKTLRTLGLDENTLLVYASDNGPWLAQGEHGGRATPLRAGKGTTYEGGQRVPCVMRWPGRIPAGSSCSEVTATMDMLPTIAALAEIEPPTDRIIDGHDIWPLMSGTTGTTSPYTAFFYYFFDNLQAVRSGKWKLVLERIRAMEFPFRMNELEEPFRRVPEALYNLEDDIGEQRNVIEEHPEVADRLRGYIERMRDDLGDMPIPGLDSVAELRWRADRIRPGKNRRPCGSVDVETRPESA